MSELENISFEAKSRITGDTLSFRKAKVKVFGVGGAGGNTVNRMKQMNIEGVEYYAVNTDIMALDKSLADYKIAIGEKTNKGLGAGMEPEKSCKAVEENIEEIKEAMKGADMVFITAGMGGGTGTGAAPVVANVARELGILTVGVVTKPFRFEGNARSKIAQEGIKNLRSSVDTIIVVENKKLLTLLQNNNAKATMEEAFKMADEILGNAVQSICGIMFHHGLVHVDFADIRKVMLKGGSALMGTGFAQGEKRGIMAADMALASPLLEDIDVKGASGVLINVAHGENYSLLEHSDAMEHIYDKVGEEGDPNIIIGDLTITELGDKVCITVIATGCGGSSKEQPAAPKFSASQTMQLTGFASTVNPAAQTVAVPKVNPAAPSAPVSATPRPTSMNFVALANQQVNAAPTMAQPVAPATIQPAAPQAPATVEPAPVQNELPSLTDSQVMRAVDAAMFADPTFDAKAPAEENVFRSSETSEFSAVADEDRFNNGRGVLEVPSYQRQMAAEAGIARQPISAEQKKEDDSLKQSGVDYSMPAYTRMYAGKDNF